MKFFKHKTVFAVLLYVMVGVWVPVLFQSDLVAWDQTVVRADDFAPGQLEKHYLKHGYQFGTISQEQYLQGAQGLLNAQPDQDVLEKVRPNGDVEHFRVSTGELAVMTKRGRIRTYFKTNYWYWLRK